jgi:LysM repeat protein
MKQTIPIKKDITFNTNISEITSISLEHNLSLGDRGIISGELIVSGDYKQNDISVNTEPFVHSIPFEIALAYEYDLSDIKIDIDDFYYEINNNILTVNIEIAIDNLKKIPQEVRAENNTDDDIFDNYIIEEQEENVEEISSNIVLEEIDKEQKANIIINNNNKDLFKETTEEIKSIFNNIDNNEETFSTYSVYIVREEDTLESIMLKYNKTKDQLLEYNTLDDFKLGMKIIIPAATNE